MRGTTLIGTRHGGEIVASPPQQILRWSMIIYIHWSPHSLLCPFGRGLLTGGRGGRERSAGDDTDRYSYLYLTHCVNYWGPPALFYVKP